MKIPSYDFWAPLILFVGIPIARAGWVASTTAPARASLGTGLEIFLNLALPPLICGILFLLTLYGGGNRFQNLRTNKASLKSMMLVGFVTPIVAGSMLNLLAGAYLGEVPDIFLRPTHGDWEILAKGTAMMSAMFFVPFGLVIYGEAKDRRSSKK